MLKELFNKIFNYDPDAATHVKVENANELLAKFIAYLEKLLGI